VIIQAMYQHLVIHFGQAITGTVAGMTEMQ